MKRLPLTFEDLADIHDANSDNKARTRPFDYIIGWAKASELIIYDKKSDLFFRR